MSSMRRRLGALAVTAAMLTSGSALVAGPATAATSTTQPTPTVVKHLTVDYSQTDKTFTVDLTPDPSIHASADSQWMDNSQTVGEYFQVFVIGSQLQVTPLPDPPGKPWLAPAAFQVPYEYWVGFETGNPTPVYGVVDVTVTNIPASPTAPAGPGPVAGTDVLSLWDGGSAHPTDPRTQLRIHVPGDATHVGTLNPRMADYFTVHIDHGDLILAKKRYAAQPPAEYWTKTWFNIPYTAQLPTTSGQSSTTSVVQRAVSFKMPAAHGHVKAPARARVRRAVLASSYYGHLPLVCAAPRVRTSGVVPGSDRLRLRTHTRRARRAERFFKVSTRRMHGVATICMQGRSAAKVRRAPHRMVVPFRMSALNRNGKRVRIAYPKMVLRLR